MTKYLWKKYSLDKKGFGKGNETFVASESSMTVWGNTNYSFNSETGHFRINESYLYDDDYIKRYPGGLIYTFDRPSGYHDSTYGQTMYILKNIRKTSKGDSSLDYIVYKISSVELIEKGNYISDIISENKNDYPNNGEKNGYWYVYQGIANNTPVISGEDSNLGEKNQPFEISYKVEDKDITDNVTVTEYLNNRQIRRITNANNTEQTLKITQELLNSCPLGETNTINIYAEDEKGAGTYRN